MRLNDIIIVILLAVIAILGWLVIAKPTASAPENTDTSSVATTTPIPTPTETTPPLSSKVVVTTPKNGAVVSSTFAVEGQAPGPWYFEASFPIQVRDAGGNVLATTPAQAQGEWMTEALVPFKATLTIKNYSGPATLILLKDNPSGLPENDDAVSFPIVIGK